MVYIIGSNPIDLVGSIIDNIEKDKNVFRINRDNLALDSCRLILGEIQRDPNKDTSDENVTKILRNLRKQTLKHPTPDMLLIQMIDTYISPPVADEEVIDWIIMYVSNDEIREMGKRAYSIIGKAKAHFDGREINTDIIKEYIDGVLNE